MAGRFIRDQYIRIGRKGCGDFSSGSFTAAYDFLILIGQFPYAR
jgi:hypothetical protein